MSASPHNVRSIAVAGQVPAETAADRIRDRMALRRSGLEAFKPEVLDLAAEVVAILHERLHGCATALRGDRAANYWRQVLRGEHPFAIEDLARLALEPGSAVRDAVAAALTPLAHAIGYQFTAETVGLAEVPEAAAALAEAAGPVMAQTTRALADGRVDPTEADAIARELEGLKRRTAALEGALTRARVRG